MSEDPLSRFAKLPTSGEYGIVANCIEVDRALRTGAKCWLAGGTGGEGFYRFQWIGMSRSGRYVRKWLPIHRLGNFRAKWIPPELDEELNYIRGSRDEIESLAVRMSKCAEEERLAHPNRIGQVKSSS